MTPLTGVRVVLLAGAGPAPFAGMLLRDLGAEIVRVDRPGSGVGVSGLPSHLDSRSRGVRSVVADLKTDEGRDTVRRLATTADVFIDPYRPGVVERFGLGPAVLCAEHPPLVYVHMTGWGHDGAWAQRAGHDINYLAVAGALYPTGPADRPPLPPLNLLADFGAGGTYLVMGVLAALLERIRTGRGTVLDVAMTDAVASLTTLLHDMRAAGLWTHGRESNIFDGGAPFYRTYRTADGGFMAVGAIEPAFHAALLAALGIDPADWPQHDRDRWPAQRDELARIFAGRTRADWERVFADVDACVTPVLTPDEAPHHPALASRGTFTDRDGYLVPGPWRAAR
ncbi:CoA transferase [Dactylosporangium sp. NBC_01737]|uniref:CaiB/BaiF CoA transferase family protein n=1 Tax=Dactylosporangium sp. NBC_01737 TaxID=2975959 RepID=UPI002E0F8674|nr:CoA transferase [Dactylosporangium sp. NBC_01737]